MIPSEFSRLAKVRAIALDLDGVVYVGSRPLPGASEAIRKLRELGIIVYFVTNNSAKTRAEIANKLTRMGIPAAEEDVITSGYAAGVLIAHLSPQISVHVLVVGSDGLKAEVARSGVQIVSTANQSCEFLVVGFDQGFTYEKICTSLDALLGGATFIACNRDGSFPTEGARFLPGCGAMVAAIEAAWGKKADYEVGKPNTMLLEIMATETKLRPDELLVVGDTLESDIAMSLRYGSPSVLVRPVEMNEHQPRLEASQQLPSFVVSSILELPDLIHAAHLEAKTAGR